jgi:hypothetical protein
LKDWDLEITEIFTSIRKTNPGPSECGRTIRLRTLTSFSVAAKRKVFEEHRGSAKVKFGDPNAIGG